MDAALSDWRFGETVCIGVQVIYTVNLYGSVLILAFISLDRYLAVVRATDTNTGGLRQLLAHRLVYVGEYLNTVVPFSALYSTLLFSNYFLSSSSLQVLGCLLPCWQYQT